MTRYKDTEAAIRKCAAEAISEEDLRARLAEIKVEVLDLTVSQTRSEEQRETLWNAFQGLFSKSGLHIRLVARAWFEEEHVSDIGGTVDIPAEWKQFAF